MLKLLNVNVTYRNLLGEDLGPLNAKELEQLEHQLETSLERIRSTKVLQNCTYLVELTLHFELSFLKIQSLFLKTDTNPNGPACRTSTQGTYFISYLFVS